MEYSVLKIIWKKEIRPNQVLLICSEDPVPLRLFAHFFHHCVVLCKIIDWTVIQVINEGNYICLYNWDQGSEFFLGWENPRILFFHWFWVSTQND